MDTQLSTLSRLDTQLRTLVLKAVIARWRAGERQIASQDIHAELLAAGAVVPLGAMDAVFDNLRAIKLIHAPLPQRAAATAIHGDTRITWVHPRLLAEPVVSRRGQ